MKDCPSRLHIEYPCRVPMKIIGKESEMDPEAIAVLIEKMLGSHAERDHANQRGPYISYTFWVTLPDEHAEDPLRKAIQKLPGVVMQL